MITENLSTLKIHKITKEQYNREFDAGRIDENALYLVPDEEIDFSSYATIEDVTNSYGTLQAELDSHTHAVADISDLQPAFDGKADKSHTHTVSNISDLTATVTELNYMDGVTSSVQAQLDEKASSNHTHSYAGSSSAGGAATSANKLNTNAGSATQPVYFKDGVPVATSYKLEKSVPSNAVFTDTHYTSKNVVGATNATSNTATTLANGNVYLNSVENGAVTSSHKISGSGATTVTTDASGNIVISSTDNDTTYSAATTSAAGLMSAADKTKLNGIATGANKITVDSAMSTTSTNPVQNKVVKAAIDKIALTVTSDGVLVLSV